MFGRVAAIRILRIGSKRLLTLFALSPSTIRLPPDSFDATRRGEPASRQVGSPDTAFRRPGAGAYEIGYRLVARVTFGGGAGWTAGYRGVAGRGLGYMSLPWLRVGPERRAGWWSPSPGGLAQHWLPQQPCPGWSEDWRLFDRCDGQSEPCRANSRAQKAGRPPRPCRGSGGANTVGIERAA